MFYQTLKSAITPTVLTYIYYLPCTSFILVYIYAIVYTYYDSEKHHLFRRVSIQFSLKTTRKF